MISHLIQTLVAFSLVVAVSVQASTSIPPAYAHFASSRGIPTEIFYAIMLQESGKRIARDNTKPWPWVLNIDNQGYYFANRQLAEAALLTAFNDSKNKHSIAVGLGQIFLPGHKHNFPDVTLALDPAINLNYAAQLLVSEYLWTIEQGKPDWWVAVGRYHSPSNSEWAQVYRTQVYQRCLKVSNKCALFGESIRAAARGDS